MRESKGNAEETARIEAAHTALMMRSLTSRLRVRGGSSDGLDDVETYYGGSCIGNPRPSQA